MKKRVVVTGLGTISALGNTIEQTWEKAKQGISGITYLTKCDTTDLKTDFGGEVKDFDALAIFGRKDARRMDPSTQFAVVAAQDALTDAGIIITDSNRDDIGVIMGGGMGNFTTMMHGADTIYEKGIKRLPPLYVPMSLFNAPSANISIQLGLRGPSLAIATACAASNNAIGEAAKIIERGAATTMLAGGSEAPLVPIVLAGFSVSGALAPNNGDDPPRINRPFDLTREGFVVGEGAAVLVLEELEHAKARQAKIYGEFLGYGTSSDAYHISAPPDDGSGAALSMSKALEDAGITSQEIDYINAHGTGTKLNDSAETNAIKTVFGERAYDIPVSSTKPTHGHLLGATGAIEAVICLKAIEDNVIPPTINLTTPDPSCDLDYVLHHARPQALNIIMSNGFGLGGHNATLIFGRTTI